MSSWIPLDISNVFRCLLINLRREDLPVLDKHVLPDDFPHDLPADAQQPGDGGVRVVYRSQVCP